MCYFLQRREKQNKSRKNKLEMTKENLTIFKKNRKTKSGTTEKSQRTNPFGADVWFQSTT